MAFGDFDRFPDSGKRTKEEINDLENFLVWTSPLNEIIKTDIERQIALLEENVQALKEIEITYLGKILPGFNREEVKKYASDNIMSVTPRQSFNAPPYDSLLKKDGKISKAVNEIKKARPYIFKELQKISYAIKCGWDKIDRLNKILAQEAPGTPPKNMATGV